MYHVSRKRIPVNFPVLKFIRTLSASVKNAENNAIATDTEKKLVELLRQRFSNANEVRVSDVSGGCGAMFDVTVISPEFKNLNIVKQHQMVTDALKEEIKQMHGLRISTSHKSMSGNDS